MRHHLRVLIAIVVPLCVPTGSSAISLLFDYTYDSLGFFGGSNTNRRDTLEAAGSFFETYLNDDLLELDAANSDNPLNTWAARFTDPSDGSSIRAITNLVVPSDTLTIFVGARDLPGTTIGQGGPGGVWVYGTASWLETVIARGESGALGPVTNDFGPWGGALSFDSAVEWYFDDDVSTLEAFPSLNDFYSVAIHELAHLFGFGLAPSFNRLVSELTFTGTAAVAEYGGAVPMYNSGHWLTNAMSSVFGGLNPQEAAMDPDLLTGTRKYFTDLDAAALTDLGWTLLIPEPRAVPAILGLLCVLAMRRRKPYAPTSPR